MKNDKKWLKEEVKSLFDKAYHLGKMEYHESEESIHRINSLVDQLDEPETLSQEWIDDHKVARIDNLRKMTTSDVVTVENLKNLLVPKQYKPVIPQFVADYIESQDDPIYEMCINYEMWGVNGDDGTTSFTREIAEWFDDNLNVKKYYRACLDGYEVEKEPQWVVRYEDGYFSEEIKFGCGIDGDWVDEVSRAYHFTDKAKAEAVALLIGGTVEEVTE